MAAFTFNIAKGRIVEFFLSAPGAHILLLEQAQSDAILKDYDTLSSLLANPANVEVFHPSYARKENVGGTVFIDDVLEQGRVDLPALTWVGLASPNPIVKVIVSFNWREAFIPLTCHDLAYTPDGSDLTVRWPA